MDINLMIRMGEENVLRRKKVFGGWDVQRCDSFLRGNCQQINLRNRRVCGILKVRQ